MKRPAILSALFVIVALTATQWSAPRYASAEAQGQQMAVILSDGAALGAFEHGTELAGSFIGLLTTLRPDLPLMFVNVDDPSMVLGPVARSDPEYLQMQGDIDSILQVSERADRGGLDYALLAATELFGDHRAAPGSEVYVITGDGGEIDVDQLSHRASLIVPRFRDNGWPINTLSLPDSSSEVVGLLARLASESNGNAYELSVANGFKPLTDSILSEGSKGSLNEIGQKALTRTDLFTSVVSIAPGTRETTLLFFMESPYGSVRLNNPSGFEVSVGDRRESYVTETPNVVVWRMVDPTPGDWKVDARGMEGLFSAWEYSSNKYSLVIRSPGPVPLGEPTTMIGYIADGQSPVILEGARLTARLTTPEGTSMVLDMRDDGQKGDAKAGDGFHSMTLPPLAVEGEHKVEMELSWEDYKHRVATQTTFETRPFPSLEVESANLSGLTPGERTKVATVFVHIEGAPYPVPTETLVTSVTSQSGQEGVLEVEPRRLFGDGPAWEYDVYFTPQEGRHTLLFRLGVEYAGRSYTKTSDSFVLSSELPPSPAIAEVLAPVPLAVAPIQVPDVPAVAGPSVVPSLVVEPAGFPWLVLSLTVVFVGGMAGISVFLLTRARPHGYLFDDGDEPLVDFAKVKRHPILGLLYRGYVKGSQLNVPGLEGVEFQFSRNGVKIRRVSDDASVRVNNQPLVNDASIRDRTWIGARGKLYSFLTSSGPIQEGASAD